MSLSNTFRFGKNGAILGLLAGAAIGIAFVASGGLAALGGLGFIGAVTHLAAGAGAFGLWGGLIGGAAGGLIGAFSRDKTRNSDLVPVQLPSGRILDVTAGDLQRAHEQEATRFQDMVERSQSPRYR